MHYTFWSRSAALVGSVLAIALIVVFGFSTAAFTDSTQPPQQDVLRLENRITQLEQRLYTIETNVRNIDQQSRFGGVSSRNVTPEDLVALRTELQTLQQRMSDYECGLAKLDERTLSRETREARRKSGINDPCRLNPETPINLGRR